MPRASAAVLTATLTMTGLAFADEDSSIPSGEPQERSKVAALDEEQDFARRTEHRMAGGLTLDLQLGIAAFIHQPYVEAGPMPAALLLLGYAKHIEPDVGLLARGGVLVGMPRATSTTDRGEDVSVTTRMTGVTVEGAALLYPAGRFFLGPVLSLRYVRFRDNTLRTVGATIPLDDGVSVGMGFDLGVAAGALERIGIYQATRLSFGTPDRTVLILFGIGYRR